MKINREQFLNDLNAVKAGLSPREFIEQSSCLVFQDGQVMTFNDEVACRMGIGIHITGAVQAATLFSILEKMDDEELLVRENDKGELEFRGKRKGFGVTKDAEIFLPIDRVEQPAAWKTLPKAFTEAVGLVQHCVSSDESRFLLTCIHLTPSHIEACDNLQLMRCRVETGLKKSVLVRGSSLVPITQLGMDQFALTESWIHFKNPEGLVFSCRRYSEDYPSLENLIHFQGKKISIPKSLKDASDRAAVFAADKAGDALVRVMIKDDTLKVTGEGLTGWYKEVKKVAWDGPALEFLISPELLKHISEKYEEAELTNDKLKVTLSGHWEYVTVLGKPKEEGAEEAPEEAEPAPKKPTQKKPASEEAE